MVRSFETKQQVVNDIYFCISAFLAPNYKTFSINLTKTELRLAAEAVNHKSKILCSTQIAIADSDCCSSLRCRFSNALKTFLARPFAYLHIFKTLFKSEALNENCGEKT